MARSQAPTSATEEAGFTLYTERLGPLPLINHFIERIGLHETLSRFVPSDRRCAVSGKPAALFHCRGWLSTMLCIDIHAERGCGRGQSGDTPG